MNRPRIWHLFRWWDSDRKCVQSTVQIESDKNDFTCVQCAAKELFKTLSKQSLAYRWDTMQLLQFINYIVKVWYAQFIQ